MDTIFGADQTPVQDGTDRTLTLQRIREHMQNGLESGVRSTPTFFVNGKLQDVSFGLSALFSAVEVVLSKQVIPVSRDVVTAASDGPKYTQR
ncbi:MAG TPA: hypothetical protein VEN78_19920 [Bradyrhizobium sp.]|nr:hypothetical protein [Bradyrhizobium sp.]